MAFGKDKLVSTKESKPRYKVTKGEQCLIVTDDEAKAKEVLSSNEGAVMRKMQLI